MSITLRTAHFRNLFSWLLPVAPARPPRDGDEGVVQGAAALDGFSGPSNWLGWAGYGMDNIHPLDWGTESAAAKAKARAANDGASR